MKCGLSEKEGVVKVTTKCVSFTRVARVTRLRVGGKNYSMLKTDDSGIAPQRARKWLADHTRFYFLPWTGKLWTLPACLSSQ